MSHKMHLALIYRVDINTPKEEEYSSPIRYVP